MKICAFDGPLHFRGGHSVAASSKDWRKPTLGRSRSVAVGQVHRQLEMSRRKRAAINCPKLRKVGGAFGEKIDSVTPFAKYLLAVSNSTSSFCNSVAGKCTEITESTQHQTRLQGMVFNINVLIGQNLTSKFK